MLVADDNSQAADVIRSRCSETPRVGIVLGSGLGGFADSIQNAVVIEHTEIPGYPQPMAVGHRGRILLGTIANVPIVAIDGRPHLYEGYTLDEVAFPVRIMIALGIKLLVVSNAAGAVNPAYQIGDVMIIDDQINLMWANPLIGPNRDDIGPRFPDMSAPYDPQLIRLAQSSAANTRVGIHKGVYMAMLGPSYETPAEYRMARTLGADVVGMSTIPEVLVARHAGIRCIAFSVVSNVFDPSALSGASGEEVVAIVKQSEPVVRKMVASLIANEGSS